MGVPGWVLSSGAGGWDVWGCDRGVDIWAQALGALGLSLGGCARSWGVRAEKSTQSPGSLGYLRLPERCRGGAQQAWGWCSLLPGRVGSLVRGSVGCAEGEQRGHTATRGLGHEAGTSQGPGSIGGCHGATAAGRWVSSRGRWPRRGARGCRERVSTDLSSAGRKEGRKRGRLEVLRSFLRRAGRARASRDAALCPPLPRGPRRRGAGTCPRHGFAATGSATASGAGPAGAPSEGSRAVHRFWGWPGV